MKRTYRTAQGKILDVDGLILVNEQTIAVGNMNINARGDELGPGGRVATKRNQTMDDYYRLNTNSTSRARKQVADDDTALQGDDMAHNKIGQPQQHHHVELPEQPPVPAKRQGLRGNLADSVAKQVVVDQPEITDPNATKGPQRI